MSSVSDHYPRVRRTPKRQREDGHPSRPKITSQEAPYEIVKYQRDPPPKPYAPAVLKKVHPLGKSPVIEDRGMTIAESGAIVEYLVDTYGTDHILVGTDYPADMGEVDPVGFIERAPGLVDSQRRAILGETAARLLGMEVPAIRK